MWVVCLHARELPPPGNTVTRIKTWSKHSWKQVAGAQRENCQVAICFLPAKSKEVTLSGEEPCIHVEDVQASRGICEYTCFCRSLLNTILLSYTNLLQLVLLHYLLGQSPKLGGSQSPLPLHNPASPAAPRRCTPLPPVTPSPCHNLSFTTLFSRGVLAAALSLWIVCVGVEIHMH